MSLSGLRRIITCLLLPILVLGAFFHHTYRVAAAAHSQASLKASIESKNTVTAAHTIFEDKIKTRYRSTECRFHPYISCDIKEKEIVAQKTEIYYEAFLFENNASSSSYLRGPPCVNS